MFEEWWKRQWRRHFHPVDEWLLMVPLMNGFTLGYLRAKVG